MIPVVVDLAARCSLLLGLTWMAARHLERRGASAASRHAVWLFGFAALAILPVCFFLLPGLPLRVLPSEPPLSAIGPVTAPNQQVGDSTLPLTLLGISYLIGVTVLLFRLILGRLILERSWRRAKPHDDVRALAIARDVFSVVGIRRKIEIRLLEGVVPMTWSSLRPRVLLPVEALNWDEDRLRSVLLHESGHIVRHDSLTRLAVEAIVAFYWPHPGVWLATRRMRLTQEQASDDLALSHGPSAIDYARHLLASASSGRSWQSAVAMANSTDLGRRVQSILDDTKRGTASLRFIALASALTVVLATSVSAIVLAPAVGAADATAAPLAAVRQGQEASSLALEAGPAGRGTARWSGVHQPPKQLRLQREDRTAEPDPASKPTSAEAENYRAQQARYGERVRIYNAELKRYSAGLDSYSRANAEFVRKARAYQDRIAELGPHPPPGTVLPTYPAAPTAPVYPTAPTVPVEPLQPPTVHRLR